MSKNYAEKFSPKVVERYHHKSYTGGMASKAFDWDGVRSIKVYSVDSAPLVDYNRNATTSSRFGAMVDLTDHLQTMEMTNDKAFHLAVDAGDNAEQLGIKSANKVLTREMDERVYPYLDKYNFKKWIKDAGSAVKYTAAITANNSLEGIQDATEILDECACPESGRRLYVTTEYLKLLKRNPNFVYTEKLASDAMIKGKIGELDGMQVICVPKSYLPENVVGLVFQQEAALAPLKLNHYKIHNETTDVDGAEITGRFLHDAFVLDGKAKAMCPIMSSSASRAAQPTIATNGNCSALGGTVVYYTLDGSDPRCSGSRLTLSATGDISHTSGDIITAISYNSSTTVAWSAPLEVVTTA